MAAIPFMPLYVADYMADAAHLSTAEHGAYLLLLMTYWQRGEALPDDDKKLAKIAGMSGPNWQRARPTIIEFFELRDRKLIHRRVERELTRVRDKSLKNRKGGLARAKQAHSERSADATKTLSHTDTDTDSAVAKATGADAPSDKQFWDSAKAYLGKSRASKIGQWCSAYGQGETAKAITAAQLARAVDPVPYIEKTLRRGKASELEMPIC